MSTNEPKIDINDKVSLSLAPTVINGSEKNVMLHTGVNLNTNITKNLTFTTGVNTNRFQSFKGHGGSSNYGANIGFRFRF